MRRRKIFRRKIAPAFNRLGQRLARALAEMPALRISADENGGLDVGRSRHQPRAPMGGAFPARRQVGPLVVIAGKAKAHGNDRELPGVIEFVPGDAHPVAQAVARRIVEGLAGAMDEIARRLTEDGEARRHGRLQHRARFMRQGRDEGRIHADAAGANLLMQLLELCRAIHFFFRLDFFFACGLAFPLCFA